MKVHYYPKNVLKYRQFKINSNFAIYKNTLLVKMKYCNINFRIDTTKIHQPPPSLSPQKLSYNETRTGTFISSKASIKRSIIIELILISWRNIDQKMRYLSWIGAKKLTFSPRRFIPTDERADILNYRVVYLLLKLKLNSLKKLHYFSQITKFTNYIAITEV